MKSYVFQGFCGHFLTGVYLKALRSSDGHGADPLCLHHGDRPCVHRLCCWVSTRQSKGSQASGLQVGYAEFGCWGRENVAGALLKGSGMHTTGERV